MGLGRFASAETLLHRFTIKARTIEAADVLLLLAQCQKELGRFREARRSASTAFRLFKSHRDVFGAIKSAQLLGDLERLLEDFRSSFRWYQQTHALAKKAGVGFVAHRIDAELGMALAIRGMGDWDSAIKRLTHLIDRLKNISDKPGLAYACWALGSTQRFAGQLTQAEKNLRQSLEYYRQLNDQSGFAYASAALGGTLRMKGEARESLLCYRKANGIFSREKDSFGLAYSHCGWGNALRMQGDLSKFYVHSRRAETIYRKLSMYGPLGFVLWSQSMADIQNGTYREAEKKLREAEKLFSRVSDRRGLAYVALGRGELYRHSNPARAKKEIKVAERLCATLKLRLEAVHALVVSFKLRSPGNNFPLSVQEKYRRLGVNVAAFSKYRSLP